MRTITNDHVHVKCRHFDAKNSSPGQPAVVVVACGESSRTCQEQNCMGTLVTRYRGRGQGHSRLI